MENVFAKKMMKSKNMKRVFCLIWIVHEYIGNELCWGVRQECWQPFCWPLWHQVIVLESTVLFWQIWHQKGWLAIAKLKPLTLLISLILTLSNAFLSINDREMDSESGLSVAMGGQPFPIKSHFLFSMRPHMYEFRCKTFDLRGSDDSPPSINGLSGEDCQVRISQKSVLWMRNFGICT